MYDFLSRLSADAPDASSFLGTASSELTSSSRSAGWTRVADQQPVRRQVGNDGNRKPQRASQRTQHLQKTYRNRQVVAAGQLRDLADVAERRAHDNRLVAKLLVVVVDALDRGDARVLLLGVRLAGRGLVPVEDTTDEGRDEVGTGLGGGNGLGKGEHEGQVGVDAVLALELVSGLDTLPGRGELNEDARLVNAGLLVELVLLSVLCTFNARVRSRCLRR